MTSPQKASIAISCVPVSFALLKVCWYVERNALSAGLVERAEDWQQLRLWVRQHGTAEQKAVLTAWPTPRPANWLDRVNSVITAQERSR